MHDAQLVDTTCTDQDEDEERDLVHHEFAPTLVGRFLDIGGRDSEREVCGFGKMPGVPRFVGFPPFCEEDFHFLLPFLLLPRDFASFRSVNSKAKPSKAPTMSHTVQGLRYPSMSGKTLRRSDIAGVIK